VFQLNQHTAVEEFIILHYNLEPRKLSGGGAIINLLVLESSVVVVIYRPQYGFCLVNDGRREIVTCNLEAIWILLQMQYKYRIFMIPPSDDGDNTRYSLP
jgi:hypothetical protein